MGAVGVLVISAMGADEVIVTTTVAVTCIT